MLIIEKLKFCASSRLWCLLRCLFEVLYLSFTLLFEVLPITLYNFYEPYYMCDTSKDRTQQKTYCSKFQLIFIFTFFRTFLHCWDPASPPLLRLSVVSHPPSNRYHILYFLPNLWSTLWYNIVYNWLDGKVKFYIYPWLFQFNFVQLCSLVKTVLLSTNINFLLYF